VSAFNPIALGIGWVVLGACILVAFCTAWWAIGELVWRLIPERWRAAQKLAVPQSRFGDYIPPYVSRKALALMLVLGGPYGWLRFPSLVQHNAHKRKLATDRAATSPSNSRALEGSK
jgi:hypothetical protein